MAERKAMSKSLRFKPSESKTWSKTMEAESGPR